MATQPDDLLSPDNARRRQLNTLIDLSNKFGDSLASAFANNVALSKRLGVEATEQSGGTRQDRTLREPVSRAWATEQAEPPVEPGRQVNLCVTHPACAGCLGLAPRDAQPV